MSISLRRNLLPPVVAIVLFIGIHCAGSTKTAREEKGSGKEAEGELATKYEQRFNPAEYDPSVAEIEQLAKAETTGIRGDSKSEKTTLPETTPGFRIQVLSTTEIDTANAVKNELSNLPASVGIYVIFDSPYYKVRVGDFVSRPDANQLLRTLIDRGYTDSWIVADRILLNPFPRKPILLPTENPSNR
jgi:hypothetical protein